MAANFANLSRIAEMQLFQQRVKYALFNAALAVVAEINTTQNHSQRVTYAQKILAETADILAATLCVLQNATISAEADPTQPIDAGYAIPDGDIQFAVNSCFNALAGVAT